MTISSINRKAGPFAGNGVTVAFPFSFKVFSASDVSITKADALGNESLLALTTDYTVSLNADQNSNPGGTLTLLAPLASGCLLTATSALPYLQPTDLTNKGGFYPKVINSALDRLTIFVQQLAEQLGRALKYSITSPLGDAALPTPVANNVIGWNSSANGFQNYAPVDNTLLAASLSASGGSALLGFLPAGTGAVATDAQSKLRESVSVKDFGAVGDGIADDSAAFQKAIDSLPPSGGVIATEEIHKVNVAPVIGTKSVTWDFPPGVVISGSQTTFPRFATNGDCSPSGPYTRCQSAQSTIAGAASFASAIEAIQPSSDSKGYGALYLGAQLNAAGESSINSALNAVATANAGSSGNVFGIEVNIASFAGEGVGTQFGLSINGLGGTDVTFGIKIDRLDAVSKYQFGIDIRNARVGLYVESTAGLENALVLGSPPTRYSGNLIQATQPANSGALMLMQRNTNSAPAGYFINAINADNTGQLFAVDIKGQVFCKNISRGYKLVTTSSYTVTEDDTHIACFYAGTVTLTMPTASAQKGREINVRTITGNAVISASANVGPLIGGSNGTALLGAVAGKWAALVSDGSSSWQICMSN